MQAPIMAAMTVIVAVIVLVIIDSVIKTQTFNSTLTGTIVTYVPVLFALGILVAAGLWAYGKFGKK